MSATPPRPRVALHQSVVACLPVEVAAQVELISFSQVSELADAEVGEVAFLAPGPGARKILDGLERFRALQVLQTASAGTDWIESALPTKVTLCSATGARDAPVAEWILGALLGASTGLLDRVGRRDWDQRPLADLADWTVLVVGMGSIGRRLGALLAPVGSTVVGVVSRARDGLHGVEELGSLLPHADAVVLLTPLSDATRGLIGVAELAAMTDGALLVNAGRGGVVDTDALVTELASGRLRAVLDVVDPEPLPPDHPLWDTPGLLSLTPHTAGDSAAGQRRAAQLAADQLRRWLAAEPLVNVVRR